MISKRLSNKLKLRKEDEIQKHLKFIHKIVKLKLKYKKNQDSKI